MAKRASAAAKEEHSDLQTVQIVKRRFTPPRTGEEMVKRLLLAHSLPWGSGRPRDGLT